MANSGIEWIDLTFDFCVRLLYQAASMLGISYEEINVWLFVFILPGLLSLSLLANWWLWSSIVMLKKIYSSPECGRNLQP